MKIYKLLIFLAQAQILLAGAPATGDQTNSLFNLKGYDIPAEFKDKTQKTEIESDIDKFDALPSYQAKKYGELDHDSPNLHLEITREILNRAKDNKHGDFFQLTDEVKNSDQFKKGYNINYDEFFNNKTGKYEKQFMNHDISSAMKNLHLNDFDNQQASVKKQISFIQSEERFIKRPNNLKNDQQSQFLEVSEKEKIASLTYNWEYLSAYNCWASSRWEYAFLFICYNWVWSTIYLMWIFPFSYLRPYANICIWIWFVAYPCSSGIGGRGYNWFWLSEKLSEEGKMKEITFRLEFDVIRRVKYHSLLFMATPDQVKIEISQDQSQWISATEFVKTPDRGWWWWWWWAYDYYYPPLTFAKSVKVILKGLRKNWMGNRHGLWWVSFYSQTQTIMIMDKNPPSAPRCLARSEVGYYTSDKPFLLMNCLDAILQNDSREIYFLQELYILQWADNMCLGPSTRKGKTDTQLVTVIKYNYQSQGCKNSDEFKWVIDKLGKFMSKSDPSKCIAARDFEDVTNIQTYGSISVSATMSDSRADAYAVIDPNSSGFWAAPLQLETARWEIQFDRQYLVEEITVQFKYKPKKVSLNVLSADGLWITMLSENPNSDILLMMPPTQIKGVMVNFLELDHDMTTEFQKPAYGIKKIFIKRPGVPVSYQTCSFQGKDSKIVNRFKIELVDYIDTSYLVPHRGANLFMHSVYESTKKIVEVFILEISKFSYVIYMAEQISASILRINGQIDMIYKQLIPFKSFVKSEGVVAKGSCYACSVETASLGCYYIKKKNPLRLNGFFWVKTKCMPQAFRVYCDFQTGEGNLYQYIGNLRDKATPIAANTIEKLQAICVAQGLEGIEIKSKEQVSTIIEYLNLIGANSEDEIGIPFGYQYDVKYIGDKFQSLGGKGSRETTAFLSSFMETQTMMDKLANFGANLMYLGRSKNKLQKGFMGKTKLRGIVCSENKGAKEVSSGQTKITCDTTLQAAGSPKINTILKMECPGDCGKAKGFKVFGKSVFSDLSSICRSAVHSGAITDVEGGLIEVKVVSGQMKYDAALMNEVQSFESVGSVKDKAIQVMKKPIEQACPNLKPKKKSFISFDEIINKIKSKKTTSFIEAQENIKNQLTAQSSELSKVESNPPDDPTAGAGEPEMDMVKAMGYVNKQLSNRLVMITKYTSFIKDTQELYKMYENTLASIYGSSLNPFTQQTLLSTTLLRIQATKQMIQDLVQKGQAKLAKMLEQYIKLLDDLFFLRRYEPHNEIYELDYQSSYQVIDSSKGKNGPSQWKYSKDDVFPHKEAIAQFKDVTCGQDFANPGGECTATIQNLKYKKFYDFKLSLDFKVRKQGFFGIIFRQKDQYNYYAFEMKNDNIQFRRMKDGVQKVIKSAQINKILSDTWYNVKLVVSETKFNFYLGKETDPTSSSKYENCKLALTAEDQYFKNGYQALFSDGTLGFFVDNYKISPLDCWKDPFNEEKAINYKVIEASRFIETYKADINQVWIQNSKENTRWDYEKNAWKRKTGLKKKLSDTGLSLSPIILKKYQYLKGWVGFDMYRESKRTEFSFVFYYQNDKNYFELVMIGKKYMIREVENGKKSILITQIRDDLKLKTWYRFYFQITKQIDILFEEALPNPKDRVRDNLFAKDIEKMAFKGHFIGFNVNKGSAAIDRFVILPGLIPEPIKKDADDDDGGDGDDEKDTDPDDDDNEPVKPKSCEELGNCKVNEFNYDPCINTTKSMQHKWCEKDTGGMLAPLLNCEKDFCNKCCSKMVPEKKQNIKGLCVEQCMPTKNEPDQQYFQCFNSKDPKHSVQAICAIQFPEKSKKHELNQCQTDFCDMCCAFQPLIIGKGVLKDDNDNCYKKCHEKFDK